MLPVHNLRVYLHGALRFLVGACPHCRPPFGMGVVYRTSRRSVTMRCQKCGLSWMMTAHQIAKAAEHWTATMDGRPYQGPSAAMVSVLIEWAGLVNERRGRRSASGARADG
jgi:hypothetical protein